ncbi:Putative integrase, superantigen-encoding pathogenicity islands SaPI [endosymbiont DhMRE of Dentiscutata heterogama]|uniref:hypothetical protein n=1 Tax=endosymbiont DhMRE of Dentiscutata heterogama TaxID=1609546 RepID=UPI000629DB27|nr:hypothetical protein [endosymbiont DhMRE of Dentiscutata heterogama]CFW92769.1 Putative integrase, superantigen-encoding pathogenicity islands SaPI [endosymbiont DhMRE of Dentiscutata heterogama]
MPYEQFNKKKKKKTIYLIIALIATVAIGGMVYWLWPKKETKTETKSQTEQKISQL